MPYVDAVVAVTAMRILLFVLHVYMLRECDGARLTTMLVSFAQKFVTAVTLLRLEPE